MKLAADYQNAIVRENRSYVRYFLQGFTIVTLIVLVAQFSVIRLTSQPVLVTITFWTLLTLPMQGIAFLLYRYDRIAISALVISISVFSYGINLIRTIPLGFTYSMFLFVFAFALLLPFIAPRFQQIYIAGTVFIILIIMIIVPNSPLHGVFAPQPQRWLVVLDLVGLALTIMLFLVLIQRQQSRLMHLLEEMRDLNNELIVSYDATLKGWSNALDLRDKETEGHSIRVTALCVSLARHLGVAEEEVEQMRRGALLHDIGKIGIPDAILHKPGALTEEEWSIMRRHPTYAYELLYPIPFLRPAIDIPYCHHERWDGKGYPRQLKGNEIPLGARIFAVIDVWDALTNDRPYRLAWSVAQTQAYLLENMGSQFDPEVVQAFLLMLERSDP
jgi:putative nucleotidyltransferase with HDIG domain